MTDRPQPPTSDSQALQNHQRTSDTTQPQDDFNILRLPKSLSWQPGEQQKSVEMLYDFVERQAYGIIQWYFTRAKKYSYSAKFIRYSAIVSICLGGLIPLADTIAQSVWDYKETAKWGYIFLGIGLAFLSFDRFAGVCNTWIRYITTGYKLQRLLAEFQMDWSRLRASGSAAVTVAALPVPSAPATGIPATAGAAPGGPPASGPVDGGVGAALTRLKTFYTALLTEVETETAVWAAEFQSTTAMLEAVARNQVRAATPSAIVLGIENRSDLKGEVRVWLDGHPVATLSAATAEHEIANVLSGRHAIKAEGAMAADGRIASAETTVDVPPGGAAYAVLHLAAQEHAGRDQDRAAASGETRKPAEASG